MVMVRSRLLTASRWCLFSPVCVCVCVCVRARIQLMYNSNIKYRSMYSEILCWNSWHYQNKHSQFSDHINVYIKVDTFETPVKVYIEGSTTWTKDQHIVKDLSWNKLETSLFMSAILKVVQDNIRREIEADGFIIVDKPDQEVYRSQKIQTIRRTDPKRHVTLSQFGGRFFRKWSSRLHLLWDSGHEAKLLQQDQSGNRVSTKVP